MDRSKEISMEYADALKMAERFEKQPQLMVEGDWYLCEAAGMPSFITSANWLTVEVSGYTTKELKEDGWKVTRVKVFRES